MKHSNLSCRVYKINQNYLTAVKSFFSSDSKILYDTFQKGTDDKFELFFNVKKAEKNDYGKMIEICLDKIMFIPHRDDAKGSVNFLGITADSKLFYIGKDGSIYSRNNFSRIKITSVIYRYW